MSGESTDWTRLREFRNVDLTRSYLLSWSAAAGSLLADVDLLLCPEHPFYEKPRPAEKACWRPAFIEFPYCTAVYLAGESADNRFADGLDDLGGGRIRTFMRTGEGQYEIAGEFGAVQILAERPMVRLKHIAA